jgi:hypothetical protein
MNDAKSTHRGRARRSLTLAALCATVLTTAACLGSMMPTTGTATNVEAEKGKSVAAGSTAAREMLVVSNLKALRTAEETHRARIGSYGTIDEIVKAGLLNRPADASGYAIRVEVASGGSSYTVTATPNRYGPDGQRSFFMDESGKVRGADHGGEPATADDPLI